MMSGILQNTFLVILGQGTTNQPNKPWQRGKKKKPTLQTKKKKKKKPLQTKNLHKKSTRQLQEKQKLETIPPHPKK